MRPHIPYKRGRKSANARFDQAQAERNQTPSMGESSLRIGSVFYFPNGNVAVCDQYGHQMPEFQAGWHADMYPLIEAQIARQGVQPRIYGVPLGRSSAIYDPRR